MNNNIVNISYLCDVVDVLKLIYCLPYCSQRYTNKTQATSVYIKRKKNYSESSFKINIKHYSIEYRVNRSYGHSFDLIVDEILLLFNDDDDFMLMIVVVYL